MIDIIWTLNTVVILSDDYTVGKHRVVYSVAGDLVGKAVTTFVATPYKSLPKHTPVSTVFYKWTRPEEYSFYGFSSVCRSRPNRAGDGLRLRFDLYLSFTNIST